MRIAVWHNLYSGGGLRLLQAHVEGLLSRGHELEAWCLGGRPADFRPFGPAVPQHLVPIESRSGWGRFLPPVLRPLYIADFGKLRATEQAAVRSAQEINARGFDLVFANTCEFYSVPLALRFLHPPKVLYLGEPYRPLYEANPALPWIGDVQPKQYRWRTRLVRPYIVARDLHNLRTRARHEWLNIHAADTVLVNSCYSRETVVRTYGRDAEVCYPGIDTELFRPLRRPRERFVIGVGAMDWYKGVDTAIRAVGLLDEPRPPLVWIADRGYDRYARDMAQLALDLGVDLQVRERIPDAELVELLNRAALMVYTSRLEPFGLAPLEANACGTPVVAVAEAGVRETIRDGVNGFLASRDPATIAFAMQRLLDDAALAERIGATAAEHARLHWSKDASVDRLEQHLRRVRSNPRAATRSADA